MMVQEEIEKIVSNVKDSPNRDIMLAMETLNSQFNATKELILKLSSAMDGIEKSYNVLHEEYKLRNNGQ